MRRFRFVGNPDEYRWKINPVYGKIYDLDNFIKSMGLNVSKEYFNDLGNFKDFQEVFDEPKPPHKDTDLGYYSFEIMKSFISSPNATFSNQVSNSIFVSHCIELAKELIKQLDAES